MKNSQKLAAVGEFGWLKTLLPKLFWPVARRSQLWIGPGDDAAALWITPGKLLISTTDAMVEGVHFDPKWFTPWELGYKVLSINLSDLAAMGDVKPLGALVTAAFPGDTPVDSVDNFQKGLDNCARRWKTGFIGGDTVGSQGGWFVSVALFGEGNPKALVRRSGARAGDWLMSTGPLGLAAGGLQILQQGARREPWMKPLLQAFRAPHPRFREGRLLGQRRWATSMMDCSDGLEASAKLLAESSDLGVALTLKDTHVAPPLRRWTQKTKRSPFAAILSGGEDYELIFTAASKHWNSIRRAIPNAQVLGQMTSRRDGHTVTLPDGIQRPLNQYGYAHFH